MPNPATSQFDFLAAKSRTLHGHMYVLPIAAWILKSGVQAVTPSEVMVGLGGRVDRPRIIEALVRLAQIGALAELPRAGSRDPRVFQRAKDPYWNLVENQIGTSSLADSGSAPNPPFG